MDNIAFIFPGQGAQYIGMGSDFYKEYKVSRDIFGEASEALSMDLSDLCFSGTEEELQKTENTQPALLATSISMLKVMESEGINCKYTAGLSLGEYSALVYGEVLEFFDTVKIVRERGKFMQDAVPLGLGGMAAILGLNDGKVLSLIEETKENNVLGIANYNCPGQIVVSGDIGAVERLVEKAPRLGARRAVLLPVSGPFHSKLLKPAGDRLEEELNKYTISEASKSIVSNVDAKIIKDEREVIAKLTKQVYSSVLWQQSVELMVNEGVDTFIEIGPGKSLTGFVKRIGKKLNRNIKSLNVSDLKSFSKTVKILQGGI